MYTLSRECVGGCTRAPPGPEDDTMRQYRLRAPVPAASARAARWRGRGIRAVDWQHAHGDSEGRNGRAGRRCSVRARQATWRSRPRTSRAPLARLGIRRAQERKAREGGKGGGGPRRASVRCACLGVSKPIRFPTLEISRKKTMAPVRRKLNDAHRVPRQHARSVAANAHAVERSH